MRLHSSIDPAPRSDDTRDRQIVDVVPPHIARDRQSVRAVFDQRRRRRHLHAAHGVMMQIGQVRQVQDVVLDEGVACLRRHPAAHGGPPSGRIQVHDRHVRNPGRIGQLRIAHPDPHHFPPFRERIGPQPVRRRHAFLGGNADTGSRRIEREPMVHALDRIALQPAEGKRIAPVYAPVGQCHRYAVLATIHHHRLPEQGPAQQASTQFVTPCGDVPAVFG